MNLAYYGLSDIGLARPSNEDAWTAHPDIGFFAIADGIGGKKGGAIAAQESLDYLSRLMKKLAGEPIDRMMSLQEAIEQTNQWVYQNGCSSELLHGMGSTLCCLYWTPTIVICAHVGDSRIYRFRNGTLERLTVDHSQPSEIPSRRAQVLTRALGVPGKANPELSLCTALPNDLFILCSDGLSTPLSDAAIEKIFLDTPDLEKASQQLILEAKLKGGRDNITLLAVQCISI